MNHTKVKLYIWIASKFPNGLQYFVANDLVAKMTSGKHSNIEVPDLRAMDALQMFIDDYKVFKK